MFLVKHRHVISCESALFYDEPKHKIVEQCQFQYFYNKTVLPSVLDGGNRIVLANMVDTKKLICSHAANLAEPLPSFSYVEVDRSVLCNCQIDASLSYLMKSIGSCNIHTKHRQKQVFQYVINMAFLTLFEEFWEKNLFDPSFNMSESVFPVSMERSNSINAAGQQVENLKQAYKLMKEARQRQKEKDEFILGGLIPDTELLTGEHSILYLIYWTMSSCVTWVNLGSIVFLVVKHVQMKALIAGLVLHQVRPAEASYSGDFSAPHVLC